MRKVHIDIDLELPDEYDDWTDEQIQECVFHEYINKATCAHAEDVLKYMAESAQNKSMQKQYDEMVRIYKQWHVICKLAKYSIEMENES